MSAPRLKATYTLDAETIKLLERLARLWKTSKSGVVRRAIEEAASAERKRSRSTGPARQAEIDRRLLALDRFQESMTSSEGETEAWVRQIREERRGWPGGDSR